MKTSAGPAKSATHICAMSVTSTAQTAMEPIAANARHNVGRARTGDVARASKSAQHATMNSVNPALKKTENVSPTMKKKRSRMTRRTARTKRRPTLKFTPTAWAKLLFLRDYDETEVGGFGITSKDDLLLIEDFRLVRQTCSLAHVAFDDDSVADFFDQQVDAGRKPEQFARTWLHTHPGDCPNPSGVDEETFDRVFGTSDWAVMFILAQEGNSYARLRFNTGPGADLQMNVEIDYSNPFPACNESLWEKEYLQNVRPEINRSRSTLQRKRSLAQLPVPNEDESPDAAEWETDWPESWLEYCGFEDDSSPVFDELIQ